MRNHPIDVMPLMAQMDMFYRRKRILPMSWYRQAFENRKKEKELPKK